MPKTKNITVADFFRKPFAQIAWKRGRQLFLETVTQSIPVKDGTYKAVLIQMLFASPSTGRGIVQFVFGTIDEEKVVTKSMSIESSEGTALIIWEMAKLGFTITDPMDLDAAMGDAKKKKIVVEIVVSTMGGIRHVAINKVLGPAQQIIAEENKKTHTVPKADPEPIISKTIPEEELKALIEADNKNGGGGSDPTPSEPDEVDIKPGHKIIARIESKKVGVEVLRTLEEDNELIVRLENGEKAIISANDVVGFIG